METNLHRQLKKHFAPRNAQTEVKFGRFRIDIVSGAKLIEVQLSTLAAIRDKIRQLVEGQTVEVIKPLIRRKLVITLDHEDGAELRRRWSPKSENLIDIFNELVHFVAIFPHPNLTLRVPLITIEEYRVQNEKNRFRRRNYKIIDQQLATVDQSFVLKSKSDLATFVPLDLPEPFDTAELAEGLGCPRSIAQRVAYCLRNANVLAQHGKRKNSVLYVKSYKRRSRNNFLSDVIHSN
ncbi:MAG TPA: hypothetical protein PKD64_04750 [Pirellulaceae bacterium]|nr:hypothetical protein [Pirellulaceae bacterium]HMO91483.1 hypothetical protein [Pirellulaceae bacterium]HMP70996.1 hypothetical protein [Pirellulaceae bacterium]